MSKPPLIDSGADITTDWITRAFAAGGAGFPAVTQVSTVPVGVGRGLVGEILRCRLAYADADPDAPASVIVKLPGRDRRSRTMSRRLGLHEREYAFYSRLRDDVLVRTPCLYYIDYDAETDDCVIVQEDLNGMVQVDQIAGATAEQARVALHGITMLHAQFLGQTRNERFAARVWMKRSRWELFLLQALYLWFLPSVRRDFGEYLSPPLNRVMLEFGCSMISFWRRSARLVPLTFTHGDYRLDNLFFDPDNPSELAVIDWQVCSIGSGMRDLALFLATNVEPDVRRTVERDVIEEYGEAMARAGTDIAFDVWWHAYRMHILGHLQYAVMVCGGLEAEAGPARELVRKGLRRTLAAVEDLNVDELLPSLGTGLSTRMLWSGFHGVARALTAMRPGG
ncbi:MAG: phosphotransferase [Caldilineaceae bacterium]|nr:phosphotransferase [Caldilineaceae bacterium]